MRLTKFAGPFGGTDRTSIPGICDIGESMEELREIANGSGPGPARMVGNADMSGTHNQRGLPMSDDRSTAQQGASVFNMTPNPESGFGDGSRRGETGRDAALGDDPPEPQKPSFDPNDPAYREYKKVEGF
ncbi:MAG TPA: hypothetical protein VHD55_00415 [Candidatus Paceibacterota bacterium]|nr:hypothetical protein [Candidatus Paceibacterota bacterium]